MNKRTPCERCTATKKDGTRCKNMTCKWSPTCYVHRQIDIKDSTLPNAGRGGFARKDLKKGDTVGRYTVGTHKMTQQQLNELHPDARERTHIWGKGGSFYDAKRDNSVAGIFNNCRTGQNCRNNAKINSAGNIKLTQNVAKGREIFTTGYGSGYWRDRWPLTLTYRTIFQTTRPLLVPIPHQWVNHW